ncbi:hypothetical protein T4D_2548 [Trichinella pseudospiralis]|uniref:Uncharacterized protein n=1 Tax=Trichinella pseudospiralis TaxID=6337 RepID=A0A0V1FXN3_TRIPS|nr:hypothetical protein T4D_2548 [Trichinella pseudospiralis]
MSDQSGWTIQLADTSLDQLDRSRSDIESFGRVGFKARLHLANVETNIFWLPKHQQSLLILGAELTRATEQSFSHALVSSAKFKLTERSSCHIVVYVLVCFSSVCSNNVQLINPAKKSPYHSWLKSGKLFDDQIIGQHQKTCHTKNEPAGSLVFSPAASMRKAESTSVALICGQFSKS